MEQTEIEVIEEEKEVYQYFRIGVILKGLISVAEVVVGTALFFIPANFVADSVAFIMRSPLGAPAYSAFTSHLVDVATSFTAGTALFLAIYLLSRGLVKVFIIWGLLANKLWAYPVSLIVLSLFLFYQSYQIYTDHSVLVLLITIFDIVVMYFIWREYKIVQAHLRSHTPVPMD